MQCYRYLAATTALANAFEALSAKPRKLPHGVIAEWMEVNPLEAEELIMVSADELRDRVAELIEQSQPEMTRAA